MGGLQMRYDDSDTSDDDDDDMHRANGTFSGSYSPAANGTAAHSQNEDDDDLEELLKQWKRTFPSRLKPDILIPGDLVTFMDRALTLVNSSEENMETVVMALASDGGLARLRELLDRNFDGYKDDMLLCMWDSLLLVYLKIMAHDKVLESDAIDRRHGILLTDLYGDDGDRSLSLFTTAYRSLLAERRQATTTSRINQENFETCITVLSCMLSQCTSVGITVTKELRKVIDSMLSDLGRPYLNKSTGERVLSIRETLVQSFSAQNGAHASPPDTRASTPSMDVSAPRPTVQVQYSAPRASPQATSLKPPASTFTARKPVKPKVTSNTRNPDAATSAVPEAVPTASQQPKRQTATTQTQLSIVQGPFSRHDNDKEHIANIQIMPTLDEVLCTKPPYLPREDPSSWHKSGMPGVIDRHFRLVREDTVGQLRLAAKIELDTLKNPNAALKPISTTKEKDYDHYEPDNKGARTNVYQGAALDRVLFDTHKGMQFVLTVNQPSSASHLGSFMARDNWWKREQRLGPDSLLCLLSSNGGVHFLVVHNPPPLKPGKKPNPNALHKRYSLGAQRDRAFVIAELATTNPDDASALLRTLADTTSRRSLVEFPGQILQSFAPTLAALQTMSKNINRIQLADALTPDFKNFKSSPPAYSQARGFQYSLEALLPARERNRSGHASMASVLKRSVLDDAQQDAVKHALTNELALIQGPPGTGKSFTGVKLIEALLENKDAANLGPIVCVCFTNHALDQLLEHLMDSGVTDIIRIGGRSKSERLAPVNIREVANNYSFQGGEGAQMGRARKHIKKGSKNIYALLDRWQAVVNHKHAEDAEIMTILARDYPALHEQLLAGNTDRGHFARSPVEEWLQGGLASPTSRPANKNSKIPAKMYSMSNPDRRALHQHLLTSIFDDIYQELQFELQSFYDCKSTIDMVRGELDLRALSNTGVIGVTTSGLAGKYKRLTKLRAKVVVVEEAGEVLEAHLLTAMLPSIQHAILIGDHKQLRPKVNNYDLSVDNPCSRITLDVSLFERLVMPRFDDTPGLPFVTLEMQRRMHPSVSHLIRSILPSYKDLRDAPNVSKYPPVAGMAKRLFWLDHRNKEDDTRKNPQSVSQSNQWEVGMVAALVSYLVKQGVYSAGDIAVLTPYSGQVKELQAKLGSTFGIMLSERDIDDGIQDSGSKVRSQNTIRLSTVDAFQGEEAKVIIISMVRSNDKNLCGFLATENRINVLLSRAMHGMYIIGNSRTTSTVPMWQKVVDLLKAEGNFGPALEIACGRHPNSQAPVLVREPRDFSRVSPAAGCNAECGEALPCGHLCSEKCHSEAMHNRVKCRQQCNRPKKDCEHLCKKPCGEECETNCKAKLQCDIVLPCGHHLTEMYCFQQRQEPSNIRCRVKVERDMSGCGHKSMIECYISINDAKFHCREACAAALACGHSCGKECADCRPRDRFGYVMKEDHGRCEEECGREFANCSHLCSKQCHGSGTACPPCNAPCQPDCAHLKCSKRCNEPCPPCTEECPSGCPHSSCGMPCAAPCDFIPCSKRCKEKLKCGHSCPSVCGEKCPTSDFCHRCANDAIMSEVVDPITKAKYEDVEQPCLFLPCGHFFTVEALDRYMDMSLYYEMDEHRDMSLPAALKGNVPRPSSGKPKGCPKCHASLHTISRYGRLVRPAMLQQKTQKFISSFDQSYVSLTQELQQCKDLLAETFGGARLIRSIVLGNESITSALKSHVSNPYRSVVDGSQNRYLKMVTLRVKVRNVLEKVQRGESPFKQVRDMIEAAGRGRDPDFLVDQDILQTGNLLLAIQALSARCDLAIATDLVALWQSKQQTKLSVDFSKNRKDCDALLKAATESRDVLRQIEAHIFWAQFLALDCAVRSPDADAELTEKIRIKQNAALARLAEADELCKECPEETEDVFAEIAIVRDMLSKG